MKPVTLVFDSVKNELVILIKTKETWRQKEFKQVGSIKLGKK